MLSSGNYSPTDIPITSVIYKEEVHKPPLCAIALAKKNIKSPDKARIFSPTTYSERKIFRLLALFVFLCFICTACTTKNNALDKIRSAGVLRIAMDPSFAPFEFVNDENNLSGFDIDLSNHIADALGVQTQFVSTGYDALYDALTVKRADIIISALYPDPGRTQAFAFSTPYFNAGDVLLVAYNSPITHWESLGGKRVACIFGTAGHMTALNWQKTITPQPTLITVDNPFTLTKALVSGMLDAVILDHVTAINVTGAENTLQILPLMITDEPYVIAARIEDKTLIKAIDDILDKLRDDGVIQQLIQTHFF